MHQETQSNGLHLPGHQIFRTDPAGLGIPRLDKVYLGLTPLGTDERAAFMTAPLKCWLVFPTGILFAGIRDMECSVAEVYLSQSVFLKFHRRLLMLLTIDIQRPTWNHGHCWLRAKLPSKKLAVGVHGLPHQWPCRASVDARGLYGLSSNGRSARHHSLNDQVWRAMAKADTPALKEPTGLLRTDGTRPDGVTLLPWKQGKCAMWNVTVSDTFAQPCVHETSQTPGAIAEAAAERKTSKCWSLTQS